MITFNENSLYLVHPYLISSPSFIFYLGTNKITNNNISFIIITDISTAKRITVSL